MEKSIYSLTYCYEGTNGNTPYCSTLAVSYDREKLVKYMKECVEEDCREPEEGEDEFDVNDNMNFLVWKESDGEVCLRHKTNTDLYVTYKIRLTDFF